MFRNDFRRVEDAAEGGRRWRRRDRRQARHVGVGQAAGVDGVAFGVPQVHLHRRRRHARLARLPPLPRRRHAHRRHGPSPFRPRDAVLAPPPIHAAVVDCLSGIGSR